MPLLNEIREPKDIGRKGSTKHIWHACERCGKERWVELEWGKPESKLCRCCSSGGKMRESHNWKGGRAIHGQGYIYIRLSSDDFFYPMAGKRRYVFEHRLVMAKHLNRCLLPWEVVHHKNGIKDDNRIENLELVSCRGKHNTQINRRMKELEKRVMILESENILLRWQIEDSHSNETHSKGTAKVH